MKTSTSLQPFPMSRRRFLAVGAGALAPLLLPAKAFAAKGDPRIGIIGLGARGRALLDDTREQIVALCDVDARALEKAKPLAKGQVSVYKDYRELLLDTTVDAVIVATPHHWHALHCVQACEAGKDVYLETPSCMLPGEAARIVDTARRYGAMVQTGAEAPWTAAAQAARAYLRSDAAGALQRVVCTDCQNPAGGALDMPKAVPEGLDWDAWLGPAPAMAYTPQLLEGWRWVNDLGGGYLFLHGAPVLSAVWAALGRASLGKVTVEAHTEAAGTGLHDCPQRLRIVWRLESPALELVWEQGDIPPRKQPGDARFEGDKSAFTLTCCDGAMTAPPEVMAAADPKYLPLSPMDEWYRRMALRDAALFSIEDACRVSVLCALGHLACRLGRPLEWDETTGMLASGDPAQVLLAPAERGPWRY